MNVGLVAERPGLESVSYFYEALDQSLSAISPTKEVLLRRGAQIRPDAITFKTYTLF